MRACPYLWSDSSHCDCVSISLRPRKLTGRWRPHREFVGRLEFGVRWLCWNPDRGTHNLFPRTFRRMVEVVLMAQARMDSSLNALPVDLLFYALNMCTYWWGYGSSDFKAIHQCVLEDAKLDRKFLQASHPRTEIEYPPRKLRAYRDGGFGNWCA